MHRFSITSWSSGSFRQGRREYPGPDRLDFQDMAAIASRVLGKAVTARARAPEAALAGRGFTAQMEAEALAMYAHYDRHGLPGNSNVLEMILRRMPGSFEASVTRHFSETPDH
ncbi:hypothetical protein PY365_33120 [Roseiarcaceae bacterium H3SJ34-1]|uniref:hypothetical protein n=1 Tax=Terripilifer ovatus TaxID=3032367 RepID=UPI003AB95E1B|nr:hypothetical protein [Roseiarcaceae bacterium H3SJ34-1]